MTIGGSFGFYNPYAFTPGTAGVSAGSEHTASAAERTGSRDMASSAGSGNPLSVQGRADLRGAAAEKGKGTDDEHKVKGGRRSSPADCQTCKERKYQDGSNESDVSFKAPGHISPEASASTVMAHEQQHVANAYQKASEKDGKVVSCSVSLHTAVCPECGTVYVSGGTTNTSISYPNESNPYQKNKKAQDAVRFTGANINYAV